MNKLLFVWLNLLAVCVKAQNYEPLEIAQKILSKEGLPNIKKYSTNEYKGKPNGIREKDTQYNFKVLEQSESTAVVNVTALDKTNDGIDLYLHFTKEENWKLGAIRTLAMTGILYSIKDELEKMEPNIDSILGTIDSNDSTKMFRNREEFNYELGNVRLTLALDDSIIDHFNRHKNEFVALKNALLQNTNQLSTVEERSTTYDKKWIKQNPQLLLSSITYNDYEVGNGLTFTIGGMIDNSVGYVYFEKNQAIPKMSPDRIIMLRELGDGWYIFKTT